MMLYEALNIDPNLPELICFVGAGGKTTSIFKLAKEFKQLNKKVLVTTTTAILCPEKSDSDMTVVTKNPDQLTGTAESGITCLGSTHTAENKLLGIDPEHINLLFRKNIFDLILVEGDGSKQKPIKAPAEHEPVIPSKTTKLLGVIGLDALDCTIDDDHVHRPEQFCRITRHTENELITYSSIAGLIISEEGLFKKAPHLCQRYVLLNKADSAEIEQHAKNIIREVKKISSSVQTFIISTMLNNSISVISDAPRLQGGASR
jgi:probable selenium-dependent hydroxylase accessory protein YqeC